MLTKTPAFLDGYSFVHYNENLNQLFVGNSGGLVKVFNLDEPDSEPVSVDIPDNLTSITSYADKLVVTDIEGQLTLLNFHDKVSGNEDFELLYQTDSPLRDAVFINEGKRIVCGADNSSIVVIDCTSGNRVSKFPLLDKFLNVSYNAVGELLSVALANGEVHVFSVVNETPELVEKLPDVLPAKTNTSVDSIDYTDENSHELVCTKPFWSSSGENLFVPTSGGSIKSFNRSDWGLNNESGPKQEILVAHVFSPNKKNIALLYKNGTIDVVSVETLELIKLLSIGQSGAVPTSITWLDFSIYVGGINGDLYSIPVALEKIVESNKVSAQVDSLFLDEASESEAVEDPINQRKRNALDDSMIIDEEDDFSDANQPFEQDGNTADDSGFGYLSKHKKRARFSDTPIDHSYAQLPPYSPGSTPWIQSSDSSISTRRRYLFMSSIGYSWCVQNVSSGSEQKSITISFFDRSVNKDYHFIDHYDYDLCSMNETGIILGSSGFKNLELQHKGRIYYRNHSNIGDSWEKTIPLLKTEYISSICLTSTANDSASDSIIVVGTNLGYLRFFNVFGLCINLMKVSPVVCLISSAINTVFSIHQTGVDHFCYSLISVANDYKFLQQECSMPLSRSGDVLLKGVFFNEYSDPCFVAGVDDTLTVLSHWRDANNSRWVPLLSCGETVTDYGLSLSKKNWKCWPLGLQSDKLICLVLKNNDEYPGFPLPLPIELDLKIPVNSYRHLQNNSIEDEDVEDKLQILKEQSPEEEFLRSATLGKLLGASLADSQYEDQEQDMMTILTEHSLAFDKSLLKLFNIACQESRLNKAFSVVKLIRNDKALLAATRIAERHNFANLTVKINKAREDLLENDVAEEDESATV